MQAINEHIAKDGFRLRGTQMSRIDGFSDVVFGFALTLLVVSLEVPRTYDQLHAVLLGFFPFFVCFVFLIMLWWTHFRFFRRYGLHDPATIVINAGLLFTVLFYVYPLKFLFTMAAGVNRTHAFSNDYQVRELMVVYALGFGAIYLCYTALYFNAWRQRAHLRLNPMETTLTLSYMADSLGVACIGFLCCGIAFLLPPAKAGDAGLFFFSIGIWKTVHGFASNRRVRRAEARTGPEDRMPLPHSM
jgi:uncharacterized membrane protein